MKKNNPVIPYRIRQARVSRGLSMAGLAELADVSKQLISQYESGKTTPSDGTLNRIADILRYTPGFFRKPMPVEISADSGVFFRSGKTAKTATLDAAQEKIRILGEIDQYLSIYIDFPKLNIPSMQYAYDPISTLSADEIERYAKELRSFWRLGNGPIDNLIGIAQKNGIVISSTAMRVEKLDGLSEWHNKKPYIFISTDKDTNCRIRFGVAHELCHILLHAGNVPPEYLKTKEIHEKLEDEANRFAGALLLPEETFAKDVLNSSLDHFIQLKAKWKVSLSAMIKRCESLGLLSSNQIKYLNDQMTKRRYWRNEPLDSVMPKERPFAFRQAVSLLLENNVITPSDFVNEICCYPEELENYCCLDPGTLSEPDYGNVIQIRRS